MKLPSTIHLMASISLFAMMYIFKMNRVFKNLYDGNGGALGVQVQAAKRVTVIDNTIYDGEPVLLFRLATLYDAVDRFYIVESNYSVDGTFKRTLHKDVNAKLFEPYKDKIQWIIQSVDFGTNIELDERKRKLREEFVPKVQADLEQGVISEPFVVINADVDEIINPNDIHDFQPGRKLHGLVTQTPVLVNMESFEYNLNWKQGGGEKVYHAEIFPGRLLCGNLFYRLRPGDAIKLTAVAPKIDSGYRLSNFFDLNALSNKLQYIPAGSSTDVNDDACAKKCVSGEEPCKWKRCNLDVTQWDYKQAPALLQRFHELICEFQNVDPATGVALANDSSRNDAFSNIVVPHDIEIGYSKDWGSIAEIPYTGNTVMVVDSILYNGEPILLTRLATLYDVVDRFYISEGTHSHSGGKKENLFKDMNAHLFKPYEDKIHWVVFDMSEYAKGQVWDRERDGRRSTLPSIREHFEKGEITHPFVILNTDADELPDPRDVAAFQPGMMYHEAAISSLIVFQMKFFYYNLNWIHLDKWPRANAVPGHLALSKEFDFLSDFELYRQDDRFRLIGTEIEGGYHMSFFLGVDEIRKKLETFSHQEYNREELKTDEHIKFCISSGNNIFNNSAIILEPWDYRQAPLPLQKFHKEICRKQSIDPLLSTNPSVRRRKY